MKKIVITGATGKVAEALSNFFTFENDFEIVLLSSDASKLLTRNKAITVDYFDKKSLKKAVLNEKPDVIINTAALTNVDLCETERKLAWDLNVVLPETMAKVSKITECRLITFSTDYVFDGVSGPYTEEDKPNPINYYGKTKLASENICLAESMFATVIRTNVVYGSSSYGKNDFMRWAANSLKAGKELNIITGQWCNPAFSDDIARMCIKIIEKERFGIYHSGGKDWLNRYELALKVAEVFGYDKNLINSIPPEKLKQAAARPEKGGLVTLKSETDLGINFSSLDSGLSALKYQMSIKKRNK